LPRLDNGTEIKVEHPELVLFTPSRTTAVVVEGEHVRVIDVELVRILDVALIREIETRAPE